MIGKIWDYFSYDNYDSKPPTFHAATRTPNRFLGVEIEVARIDAPGPQKLAELSKKWKFNVVHDGSLPDTGFEINTAPAKGTAFSKQIREILAVLKENKAKITRRCGLHVHVDARDFTADDLFKTIIVWNKIEDHFWKKCAKYRQRTDWCYSIKNKFISSDKNIPHPPDLVNSMALKMVQSDKYHSLNFGNLYSQIRGKGYGESMGTIENRMHQGTLNVNKIIRWGRINSNLLDYCKNISINDAKKVTAKQALKKILI